MGDLTSEQIAEVRRKIQTARDNAIAEQVVHDQFIAEYRRGITGHPEASAETHARSMQLYDFTMGGLNRKRNFEHEANLLETLLIAATEAPHG
jgi:hypothetical protein